MPELADLPPGWCWTTLGMIAEITHGIIKGRNRLRPPPMRTVAYLRYANVRRNSLDLAEVKTILADEEKIGACRLQKGDLLFTELGERDDLGRCCVWSDEIDECIHQNHVFRARVCPHLLDPKFVSFHGNLFGQKWFASTGKQTTGLATISKADLCRLPVPLAPLNEQKRIVARIEELFAHVDAGVSALKRVATNLERYRASILQAAITGNLTKAWRVRHHGSPQSIGKRRSSMSGSTLRF
jgi:type I restriction enzyme S subunit